MGNVGSFALAVVALGLGLGNIYLYRQLQNERSQGRVLLERKDSACENPAHLPPSAARHFPTALELPPSAAAPATSLSAATSGAPRFLSPITFTDEQREYFARKRYAPLLRELSISDDDSAALVPLLSEQDQRASKPLPKSRVAPDGSLLPDPDEARQSAQDEAEIAALIGPERAAKLMQARKTLPARAQMRALRLRLEDSNEPVTDEQLQRLIAAASSRSYASAPRFVEDATSEETMNRMRSWQDEVERQVREDAAGVLTPGQLKTLDEELAVQKQMRQQLRDLRPLPMSGATGPTGAAGAASAKTP